MIYYICCNPSNSRTHIQQLITIQKEKHTKLLEQSQDSQCCNPIQNLTFLNFNLIVWGTIRLGQVSVLFWILVERNFRGIFHDKQNKGSFTLFNSSSTWPGHQYATLQAWHTPLAHLPSPHFPTTFLSCCLAPSKTLTFSVSHPGNVF